MTTDLLKGIKELWHVPSNTLLFNGGGVVSDLLLYKTDDSSRYAEGDTYYFYKNCIIVSTSSKTDVIDLTTKKKITTINYTCKFFDENNGYIFYKTDTSTFCRLNINDYTTKNITVESGLSGYSYTKDTSTITSSGIVLKRGSYITSITVDLNPIYKGNAYSDISGFGELEVYMLNDGNYVCTGLYSLKLLNSSFKLIKEVRNTGVNIQKIIKVSDNNIFVIDDNGNLCKLIYRNGGISTAWQSSNKVISYTNYDYYYILENKFIYITQNKNKIIDSNSGLLLKEKSSNFFTRFLSCGETQLAINRGQYAMNLLFVKGDFDKIKII